MAWSGGTYSKGNNVSGGWVGDASVGIGIEAGRHDSQDSDFATGINTCIAKDGQNAATADLPMATFKHTNIGNATARNQYCAVGQVQDGDFIWLGTTGGTAIAQTANAAPAITAYKAGQKFRMKIGVGLASTGVAVTAHTLAINGLASPKNIVEQDGANPTIGSWVAGAIMELVYDGTNFVITNDPSGWQDFPPNLRSGTATVTTPAYSLRKFIKQNKLVTIQFSFTCAITVAGGNIIFDLPTQGADFNFAWIPTGFLSISSAGNFMAQLYIPAAVASEAVTVLPNALVGTNWAVTIAPNAGLRGTISYRSV